MYFCISAFLHFCISAFLHCYFLSLCIYCQNPLESIDWNPSGESGQESQNEIISDLSLAMFLAHFLFYGPTRSQKAPNLRHEPTINRLNSCSMQDQNFSRRLPTPTMSMHCNLVIQLNGNDVASAFLAQSCSFRHSRNVHQASQYP